MATFDLGKVVPTKGTDYFTEAEITEIETEVKNAVKTDLNFDNTIQTINGDISDLQTNKADKTEIPDTSSYITKEVNNLTYYTLATNTGSSIELSINSNTYVMSLALKNSAGTTISSGSIDLPLETMVVGASYDSLTKEIVITLKNGNTTRFSVADLVSGLQTEITSSNKLSSDLVDDTNHTNKFVTASDKSTWSAKYDKPSGGIPKTDLASAVQTSLGLADTSVQNSKVKTTNSTTSGDIYDVTYINGLIGDIDSALDTINGEVI